MIKDDIVAIIPAAGKPTNRILVNSNLPDTMLPINGKPVIDYIIDDLLKRGINRLIVVLHQNDSYTEKYLTKKFKTKCSIKIVYNDDYSRGAGYSICLAEPWIKSSDKVLVYLGDTIYKGKMEFDDNFLIVCGDYESSDKWCFVEVETGNKISFLNKPKNYNGVGRILCGLYFFNKGEKVKNIFVKVKTEKSFIEISDILDGYCDLDESFNLLDAENWYDCGNIENYYKAKIDFLKLRSFNSVRYDDLFGYITKSGKNKEKIVNEINWYKNIPNDLKIFSPRLVDYKINECAEYSIEFYGYQSLADNFVFGNLDIKFWQIIIDHLFKIIDLFKKYKVKLPYKFYQEMYSEKTIERINKIKDNPTWEELLKQDSITINGNVCNNLNYYLDKIERIVGIVYENGDANFIHGDLCLSNILFDPGSRIFKIIDPRGSFGEPSTYGDIKYDLAKLRHSFFDFYDFIISDLFEIKEDDNYNFTFDIYNDGYHQKIAEYFDKKLVDYGYDLNKIKIIEGLLFLSMIPLHSESLERQKAMYLTGIRLLNQAML